MTAPLLLVTGTGTEIGKTHLCEALLLAWGKRAPVFGYKPVESGVTGDEGGDSRRLREASTFHVKHPLPKFAFRDPVSPHRAARTEGRAVDVDAIVGAVRSLRETCAGVVVELPGGLFTPLTPRTRNVDLALKLDPTAVVVVAPDRLGVLHDLGAALTAALALGLAVSAIALSAPAESDVSTGTNASEISQLLPEIRCLSLPRSPATHLAELPDLVTALSAWTAGGKGHPGLKPGAA